MHENSVIFSRDQKGSRLFRVSPLYYAQEQLLNEYYLPRERDLPRVGLDTCFHPFDFGFSDPTKVISPYDTAYFGITFGRNFLAETLTGAADVKPSNVVPVQTNYAGTANFAVAGQPGVQVNPSYLFNFLHLSAASGNQRQWTNKNGSNVEGTGRGTDQLIFKSPALVMAGDTLTCVVQNLGNNTLRVQLLLLGGEFD